MHVESAGRQILSDESDGVENVTVKIIFNLAYRYALCKHKKIEKS